MADEIIFPYGMAENYLEEIGIVFSQVINQQGGIKREQLKVLNKYHQFSMKLLLAK